MSLDVITIISDETPRTFVEQCRQSVRDATHLAPYPVNLIEVPAVPGHIGQAMMDGISKGSAPYVAFVDDDDMVLPHAFACLSPHFEHQPTAVCAREIRLLANGRLMPMNRRHHITAYRRTAIAGVDLQLFPSRPNEALLLACAHGAVDVMSWAYVYRIWRSAGQRARAQTTMAEFEALRQWE